jgi:hypothetical protein
MLWINALAMLVIITPAWSIYDDVIIHGCTSATGCG